MTCFTFHTLVYQNIYYVYFKPEILHFFVIFFRSIQLWSEKPREFPANFHLLLVRFYRDLAVRVIIGNSFQKYLKSLALKFAICKLSFIDKSGESVQARSVADFVKSFGESNGDLQYKRI